MTQNCKLFTLGALALIACSTGEPSASVSAPAAGTCPAGAIACDGPQSGTGGSGAGPSGVGGGTGASGAVAGTGGLGAGAGGFAGGGDAAVPDLDPGVVGPGTVIAEPDDEAAVIYDQEKIQLFEVEIAQADLAKVDADPAAEQYVPARLRFDGATYDVGYRYKGSIGAFQPPCTAGLIGGGGSKIGKCSIKLSFNWTDPEGRFFGLKKLPFHAMNNDPSRMRERLGYALFREMGVPAPRAVHAILSINGERDIYALVEDVDSRFTRSRFTEGGEGNLYKEIWPIHQDAQAYLSSLETNELDNPSVDRMLRFKDASLTGADAMVGWLDLDLTTRYMAVDRVILNDDGAFHFYCFSGAIGNNPTAPGNHNYYWYEAANVDRFWIIPWDLDHSMNEAFGPTHISVDWRMVPDTCSGCSGFGFGEAPAPGCDPVIKSFQTFIADYEARIDDFVAGPFSKPNVDAKLDAFGAQLTSAGFGAPPAAVDELRAILDRARQNRGFPY